MTILNKKDVVFNFICQGWRLVFCFTGPESPWRWRGVGYKKQMKLGRKLCWMWDEHNNLCIECFQIWTLVIAHLFIVPCISSSNTHLRMSVVSVLEPRINQHVRLRVGFPGGTVVKNPPANARNTGSSPESEKSPGEGNDNPPQYSCLRSPVDRGAWWATVHQDTTQPSILAWGVSWTEEPGGLLFTRTQPSE